MHRIGMFLEEVSRVMREEAAKQAERLKNVQPAPAAVRARRPKAAPAMRALKRA